MEKFNSSTYNNIIIGNVIQTTFSNVLEFKSLPFEFTLTTLETIRVRRNSEYECIKRETKDSKFFSLLFQSLYAFLTLAGYAKSLDNFVDFLFGIISLVAALNFLQHFTRFLFAVFFQTIRIIALYPFLPFVATNAGSVTRQSNIIIKYNYFGKNEILERKNENFFLLSRRI